MSGTQQLVGAAGLGLIVANAVRGPQRADLAGLWSGSGDLTAPAGAARQIGAEALGVGVLVLAAGISPSAATTCLVVIGALWLVFLMADHTGTNPLAHGIPLRPSQRGGGTTPGTPA